MDLSALSNSKTIEIINLASDSSNSSPMRIVTSSSPKDFMTNAKRDCILKSPSKSQKKNIDNVVEKIKATNKHPEEQSTYDTDSDTDYANIITIKKAGPPKTNTQDNIISQQDTTTPQPQHYSTPIQQDNKKITNQQNMTQLQTSRTNHNQAVHPLTTHHNHKTTKQALAMQPRPWNKAPSHPSTLRIWKS